MVKQNQVKFVRVTEILYPFSGLSAVDPYILANAAKRGTRVHELCEQIMKGERPDIPSELEGYIHSFMFWWQNGHEIVEMEKRFYCDDLKITGQCDLILNTPEGLVLLDLKTPVSPSKTWPIQGSAYAYLAQKAGYDIKKIQFLQVNKHGLEPTLHTYEYDYEMFKKCYDIYMHFFFKEKDGQAKENP